MANFIGIYNFSALLRVRIEKKKMFFLPSQKLKTWLILEAFVVFWLNENVFEVFLLFIVHR